MHLKSADDKSKRLTLLQDLQKSDRLDFQQKTWLRDELTRTRKGIQGEKDSAHYLDSYFKDGQHHVVMHDLRFVVDGEVAQIDHLIINRLIGVYLIETKNYAGNLIINEQGEFTVEYDTARFGIPSPIEQSRRHERILARLLERLEITGRTQKKLDCHHVVMLHPKATIQRPDKKSFDSSNVIKADQFPSWHSKFTESASVATLITATLNARSLSTITEWGERLMRHHQPENPLRLPDFMQPKLTFAAPEKPSAPTEVLSPTTQPKPAALQKKLICASCNSKITYEEGKFCWNNSQRFGGLQYCREHQDIPR